MGTILEQLKKRRIALGLKQGDMLLRVGISRQQYQHLESKGNPRLNTLELLMKGLKGELMLIPQEKLEAVKALLEGEPPAGIADSEDGALADSPWGDLLGEQE